MTPRPEFMEQLGRELLSGLPDAQRRHRRRRTAGAVILSLALVGGAVALVADGEDGATVATESPPASVGGPETSMSTLTSPGVGGVTVGAPIDVEGGFYVKESAGWVWVSNSTTTLSRVDPVTNEVVERIEVGLPFEDMATDGTSLWLLHGPEGRVTRVDAESGDVLWTVEVGDADGAMFGIAHGAGSVWVTGPEMARVIRMDEGTGALEASIPVRPDPGTIEVLDDGVWVEHLILGGAVTHIDAADNSVSQIEGLPVGPVGLDADNGSVWTGGLGSVVHIDPDTLQVVAEIDLAALNPNIGRNHVWMATRENCDAGNCTSRVARIDPETDEVIEIIEVDGLTQARALWVTDRTVYVSDVNGALIPIVVEGGP